MQDPTEALLTEAVLTRVAAAADPRVRQIGTALVRHLHAFISEIRPTESEWQAGIAFLTQVGHLCSDTRQEFILLSDTLGVSMLVDVINHRLPPTATSTTVLGPFYAADPPEFELGKNIAGFLEGSPMVVEGSVRDEHGAPLADAIVDVWHADPRGYYDLQLPGGDQAHAGRGRLRTDDQGSFNFWTVRPAAYPIPNDGPVGRMLQAQGRHPYRPEHVHFRIQASGYPLLVTHLFAAGDPYLESDVVFGVKASLIREYVAHDRGAAPDGRQMPGAWFSLRADFVVTKAAEARAHREESAAD